MDEMHKEEAVSIVPVEKKKSRRKGCLITLVVILGILVIAVVGIWRVFLNPGISPMAKALMDAPADAGATYAVREAWRLMA